MRRQRGIARGCAGPSAGLGKVGQGTYKQMRGQRRASWEFLEALGILGVGKKGVGTWAGSFSSTFVCLGLVLLLVCGLLRFCPPLPNPPIHLSIHPSVHPTNIYKHVLDPTVEEKLMRHELGPGSAGVLVRVGSGLHRSMGRSVMSSALGPALAREVTRGRGCRRDTGSACS